MLGVSGPRTGALQLRKTAQGLELTAPAPLLHEFPEQYLERELRDSFKVYLTLQTNPFTVYEITSWANGDWQGELLKQPPSLKKKRWWQRG